MKKQILSFSFALLSVNFVNAQSTTGAANANSQWRITGNTAATSDFIGTTNNQSLLFKTNNILRGTFDTQGKFIWDGGGEVIINPGGLHRPIPSNPIAAFMLEVGGSGIFEGELNSRRLFVEEYITFMKSLKGPAINVDSIKMDSTRGIYGHTRVFGDVQIKQNLTVEGDAIFKQKLYANDLKLGTVSDNVSVIVTSTGSGQNTITFGRAPLPISPNICIAALGSGTTLQPDRLQVGGSAPVGSNVLDFRNDGANGFIDYGYDISLHPLPHDGSTPAAIPALKINSFCYGDVEIAKGGGYVSTGRNLEVGNPTRSNAIAFNVFALNRIGQRVTVNSPFPETYSTPPATYNSQFFVNRNFINALTVFNTSTNTDGDETFTVYGDGRTKITTDAENAFDIIKKTSGEINFRIKSSGFVYAREVNVMIGPYPDYVFKQDYKLMSIPDLDNYIRKYGHLPNVPTAKYIEQNGGNLGELCKVQMEKIEELTLYIIQLQKRVEQLEKK